MRSRIAALLVLIAGLLLVGVGSQAQEGPPPRITPQDLLPIYFLSLTQSDLALMRDGSVIGGHIQTGEITLASDELGTQTFPINELIAVFFGSDEDEPDRVYLHSGDRLLGRVEAEALDLGLALDKAVSVPRDRMRGIFFQLPQSETERRASISVVRRFTHQFSGFFGSLIASAAKFETLLFEGNGASSVELENRDEPAFTLESTIFGTFTFGSKDLAWVRFGQRPGEPDELALKNGDRVSGRVTVSGDLRFRWPSLDLEGFLSGDELRSQVRQVVFKIPVRFFGGGGGSRRPTPGDN